MPDKDYDLSPCPFCGSALRKSGDFCLDEDPYAFFTVACLCGATGPKENTKEKALMAWNRRMRSAGDFLWNPFDSPDDDVSLTGKLKSVDFSCILQMLSAENKTGILQLSHGPKTSALYLKNGQVVAASSNYGPPLGQLLFNNGLISLEDLQQVLTQCRLTGRRLGETLLDMGLIGQDRLREIIGQQIHETVQRLVFWDEGNYQYRDCIIAFDERGIENISTIGMMLEAFRNLDDAAAV